MAGQRGEERQRNEMRDATLLKLVPEIAAIISIIEKVVFLNGLPPHRGFSLLRAPDNKMPE